jgi:Ca2+-binding RTX toxin-like protein
VPLTTRCEPDPADVEGVRAEHVDGGDGDDRLFGEAGFDEIDRGRGDDLVDLGEDAPTPEDEVYSTALGGEGDDHLVGGGGQERLFGGPGNDLLEGGDGTDYLFGEDGDDSVHGEDPGMTSSAGVSRRRGRATPSLAVRATTPSTRG